MQNCYRFERVNYNNNNYLDSSISATYIITLLNNGRLDSIITKLKQFQPTKTTFILFNKGYKTCDKPSYIDTSSLDLVDAYLHIFEHANTHNFVNILILEDDFIFSDKIITKHIYNDINTYIINNQDYNFVYFLGCLPTLRIPLGKHSKVIFSLGTHAVIYSKLFVQEHKQLKDVKSIKDWDAYLQKYNRITYNTCLCYQLFPATDNMKNWGSNSIIGLLTSKIAKYYIKSFNIDVKVEPGYSIFYHISKLLFYIIITLVILMLILIILAIK